MNAIPRIAQSIKSGAKPLRTMSRRKNFRFSLG